MILIVCRLIVIIRCIVELVNEKRDKERLGRILRGRREELGISQEELASRADLHRTYVGSVERGERNPSFTTLGRYLEGLDMTWKQLGQYLSEKSRD